MVGVLTGAVAFMADLMKAMTIPVQLDFMAISSYGAATKSSGVVRILKDLNEDIEGRRLIADAGNGECIVSAQIDVEAVRAWRKDFPALPDIREGFVR